MLSESGDRLAVTNLPGVAHLSLCMTFYLVQLFQLPAKNRRQPIRYNLLLLFCDVSLNSSISVFVLTAAIDVHLVFIFHQFWHQGQSLPGLSSVKSVPYASTGPTSARHFPNRNSTSALASNAPGDAASFDPFIGKKVWTRWPEDNHFYEAVVTDYNPAEVYLKTVKSMITMHIFYKFVLASFLRVFKYR